MKLIPILDNIARYYISRGYSKGISRSELDTSLRMYEIEHIDIAIKNLLSKKLITERITDGIYWYVAYSGTMVTTTPQPMPTEVNTLLIPEIPKPNPLLTAILDLFTGEEDESTLSSFQENEIKRILGQGKEEKSSFGLTLERLYIANYDYDNIKCNVSPEILNTPIENLTVGDMNKFRGYSRNNIYVFLIGRGLTPIQRINYF